MGDARGLTSFVTGGPKRCRRGYLDGPTSHRTCFPSQLVKLSPGSNRGSIRRWRNAGHTLTLHLVSDFAVSEQRSGRNQEKKLPRGYADGGVASQGKNIRTIDAALASRRSAGNWFRHIWLSL